MKRQWYYRGSLKSCNYSCSYCPFSKKKGSAGELRRDKAAWFRFVEHMNGREDFGGALQIVPYGEALIHPYYWEGLAALSRNPRLDAVGAQSNFSFPVEQMLTRYRERGGNTDKLRLWGTFHPEMTAAEEFVRQCRFLWKWNVAFCVGIVGNPDNLSEIRRLRQAISSSVYVWINKMDGLGRSYTPAEKDAFLEIDPYFEMELAHHRADAAKCTDSRFVEADGRMRRCCLDSRSMGDFYSWGSGAEIASSPQRTVCTRKDCSCYLAYCNQKERTLLFFQPYPAFRIPAYPRAVFFDVDGTLIPEGHKKIPEKTARSLRHLAEHSAIYLATSRPYETARRGLKAVWDVIDGGTFGGGGRRMIWRQGSLDEITPMDTDWLPRAESLEKRAGFRVHQYKKEGRIYKVTLVYRRGKLPKNVTQQFLENFAHDLGIPDSCQLLWEEPCLQITAKGTGKREGILHICREMGYQREEVAVFDDRAENNEGELTTAV